MDKCGILGYVYVRALGWFRKHKVSVVLSLWIVAQTVILWTVAQTTIQSHKSPMDLDVIFVGSIVLTMIEVFCFFLLRALIQDFKRYQEQCHQETGWKHVE